MEEVVSPRGVTYRRFTCISRFSICYLLSNLLMLLWLSIRCCLSSFLGGREPDSWHTEQLLNSFTSYNVNNSARPHLGWTEYTVWSTISVYNSNFPQM